MNDEESTFLGNRADQELNDRPSVDDGDTHLQDIETGPSNSGHMARLILFDEALCYNQSTCSFRL
jgi:hypothetical protein